MYFSGTSSFQPWPLRLRIVKFSNTVSCYSKTQVHFTNYAIVQRVVFNLWLWPFGVPGLGLRQRHDESLRLHNSCHASLPTRKSADKRLRHSLSKFQRGQRRNIDIFRLQLHVADVGIVDSNVQKIKNTLR